MSRIGKTPIEIPTTVTVEINGTNIKVKGPKGELEINFHPKMKVSQEENQIIVKRPNESKTNKSLHGLTRSLISNLVKGVTTGFSKKLEINGVGYRAQISGNKITLNLGFSHPIEYIVPKEIEIKLDEDKKNIIHISGINKQMVGETAAKIRSFRPPEPYKGKGIKYIDERIIRKAGKTAASSTS